MTMTDTVPDWLTPATLLRMQLGLVLGLLTGYPAVRWLAERQCTVAPA